MELVGRGDAVRADREIVLLEVIEIRLLPLPPRELLPVGAERLGARDDELRDGSAEPRPDLGFGHATVLDRVVEHAGDRVLLGASVLEHERRDGQQVRHVRDVGALATLVGMEVRCPPDGLREPTGEDGGREHVGVHDLTVSPRAQPPASAEPPGWNVGPHMLRLSVPTHEGEVSRR